MKNLNKILSGICYSLSGLINPIENSFNYNKNTNKPSINDVVLSGNLKSEDLGLITPQNFLSASLPDIEFDPTQVFVLNLNTYNRNLSNEPAIFVYNSNGFDITALATIQYNNQILTVDVTQLDSFNVPLTGLFKIKFAGPTLYNISQQNIQKSLITLNTTNFIPQNHNIYKYDIVGNEIFVFNSPENNNIVNFRLFLTTPSTLVSFTLPTNIIWEELPDLTNTNSLYMFCFEWNPILNKWLGNQMWQPIDISSNSIN